MMTRTRSIAVFGGLAIALSACGGAAGGGSETLSPETITVTDNNGEQTVPAEPRSVVATDNRTFESLSEWDVELSAAAVSLMPSTIDYTDDDSIVDLGNPREPDLEAVVAVEPDLIINGMRYAEYEDKLAELVPEATILNLDPREGKPFDEELKRQTTVLGTVFNKEDRAEELNSDLDAAIERADSAYREGDTVMALTTSGGEFGHIAPGKGRVLGPVFDILGLTPALEVDNASDDHQGDDISVEAIAEADPDWLLVMDRDAAISADEEGYTPAEQLLENADALGDVTALNKGNIVFMPADAYTNDGIQTYTEFFNAFGAELEASS